MGFHLMDPAEFEAPQSPEQAPPLPDYVSGLEHPPLPDYVPGPEYLEYVAPVDDEIPDEDQHLPGDASPTTLSPGYTRLRRARKTVRLQPPMSTSTKAPITEFASAPTPPSPPPFPLSLWSSPLPQIPSPPQPILSPPLPLPSPPTYASPTYAKAPLGYKAAIIQSRATSSPPIPSPPLLLPSADHRSDILEMDMPLQKRSMTAVEEVNERVTDLTTTLRQDAHELQVHYAFMHWRLDTEHAPEMHDPMMDQLMLVVVVSIVSLLAILHSLLSFIENVAKEKNTTPMIDAAIKALIVQGVANALAEYEAHRSSGNGDDSHDSRSGRWTERATRKCTYSDFLKCQPIYFKGTEGVVGLTQWFEKTESVFYISNCTVVCQIKFATCTLLGSALTWWNSHVKTIGHDAAYGMTWKTLRKMMTDKHCPRSELKKLETEI
nr:hypothetical protein [Tanacetum cinerariifolium]